MFHVGLSADFQKPDGSPAYPSFDLSPLDDDPRIEWSFVPVTDGRIAAENMRNIDALILLGARFDAQSFPGDDRLSTIARFGVGYDTVDVDACDFFVLLFYSPIYILSILFTISFYQTFFVLFLSARKPTVTLRLAMAKER